MTTNKNFLTVFPGIILSFIAWYLSMMVQSLQCNSKIISTCIIFLHILSCIILIAPFIFNNLLLDIILVGLLFLYFIILITVTILFKIINSNCFDINPFLFIINTFLVIVLCLFASYIGPIKMVSVSFIIFGFFLFISNLIYYLYYESNDDKECGKLCSSPKNYSSFMFVFGIILIIVGFGVDKKIFKRKN